MMREKPPANQDLDEDLILWQRVAQNAKPLRDHKNTLSSSPVVKKPEHPANLVPKTIKKAPAKTKKSGLDPKTK